MRLEGKVALVTGGASGMGRSEATIFAREGARVVVADILEAEGKEVAKAIGDAARFVKLDVTNEGEWQTAVAAIENAIEVGGFSEKGGGKATNHNEQEQ